IEKSLLPLNADLTLKILLDYHSHSDFFFNCSYLFNFRCRNCSSPTHNYYYNKFNHKI
ncbi:hypothetical protein L9F63_024265, partial [Diploptera punctata]